MRTLFFQRLLAAFFSIAIVISFSSLPQTNATGKGKEHKYTNELAKETSPYLLMHAHNPTNWYAWGPEAFAKAKKEGKLVFLSVGYSSCYWCHVMERESFDNPKIAEMLNKWFVCIKVDREERPDIDEIYMMAHQVVRQRGGGWPLSMFLLPDGKPIIGGTYWPPEDKVVENVKMAGFKTVIKAVHDAWVKDKKGVIKQANAVAKATKRQLEGAQVQLNKVKLEEKLLTGTTDSLSLQFDPQYGGFGSPARKFIGTKFPTPCRLEYLLQEGQRTKNPKLIAMVTKTLDEMAYGGIYDHVGGGFHRYSTERTWTVPHFEKMLYDNAQLLEVYAKAYTITKKPLYKRVLQETLKYLEREMTAEDGRFYSSQDAETDEEEGRFYVWTNKELTNALPDKADLDFIKQVYCADGGYNFEEKYHILRLDQPLAEVAKEMKLDEEKFLTKLNTLKAKLYDIRAKREKPFRNEIALTAWSGLLIAGLIEAGNALDNEDYINRAKKAAEFVLAKQKTDKGRLLRTYGAAPGKKPKADVPGYLEDYAFLVHGLLTLHEHTKEKRWLQEAKALTDTMIQFHEDEKLGGFFFTAKDHEKLFARSKDQYDGAVPSGNSMAARNLVRLWLITGDKNYRDKAVKTFETFSSSLKDYPTSLTTMMQGLSMYLANAEAKDAKGAKKDSD